MRRDWLGCRPKLFCMCLFQVGGGRVIGAQQQIFCRAKQGVDDTIDNRDSQ